MALYLEMRGSLRKFHSVVPWPTAHGRGLGVSESATEVACGCGGVV